MLKRTGTYTAPTDTDFDAVVEKWRTGTGRPRKNPFDRKYTYAECESSGNSDAVNKDTTGKSKEQKTAKKRRSKSANCDEKSISSSQFKTERGTYDIKKPAENWEKYEPEGTVNKDPMGDTPIAFTFTCLYGDLRLAVEAMFGAGSTVHTVANPLPRLYDAASRVAMSDTKMKETGAAACVISLDTEYVGRDDGTNELVSVQMTIAHCSGKLLQVLIRPTKRPKFGALVDFAYMLLGIEGKVVDCVIVLAHFWSAEWSILEDRLDVGRFVTEVRRTPVTIGPGIIVKTFDTSRNPRIFRVLMRDTMLLSPAGAGSLSSWGDILGFEKLKLSQAEISNMDVLARDDFEKFAAYAMRDTEVCLLAYSEVQAWCDTMADVEGFRIGLTLGATSVNLFTALAGGRSAVCESVGKVKTSYVDERGRKKSKYMPGEARKIGDSLASECFHGGFNQARYAGHIQAPAGWRIYDVDLAGAYASAMASVPAVDFAKLPTSTTDLDRLMRLYSDGCMVVALVEFSFHEQILDPCLPVATSRGLQYPLSGMSYCTGPELCLAVKMGARVTVHKGEAWSVLKGQFMYVDYLSGMMKERGKHAKKSLKNTMFKEMINSLYGKVAQGINKRNVTNFSAFGGVTKEELGESSVTLPIAAATITGVIRAALFEMNHAFMNAGCKVITTTTDGSMILAPAGTDFNALVYGTDGYHTLSEGRRRLGIADADVVLEVKSEGAACDSRRTRANAIYDEDGVTIHVAQGGIKIEIPADVAPEQKKAYIGQRLLELDLDTEVRHAEQRSLVSAKKISHGKADDVVTVHTIKRIHNDYDYKRRLTDSGWTVPWRTLADVEKAQEAADGLHKLDKRATFEAMELAIRGIRITDIKSEYARAVRRAVARGHCGWHTLDIEHPAFTMTKQQKLADKNRALIILPRNRFTVAYVTACASMLSDDPETVRRLVDAILEPDGVVSPDAAPVVVSSVAAPVVVCAEPRSGEGTNHATAPVREQSDRGRSRKGAVRKPPSRPRKPVSFSGGARGGGCVVVNAIRRRRGTWESACMVAQGA